MFKKGGWVLSFALLFVWMATPISAAVLHALLVADTSSHTGGPADAELQHVQRELDKIRDLTGLELNKTVLVGGSCREAVCQSLERLNPSSEDCVLFYFIGHGYRTSAKSTPWPLLYFSEAENNLDAQLILEELIAKRPRFALLITDCCNNVMDGAVRIGREALFFGKKNPSIGYRKLFLETQGVIAITASKPGDYAYCFDTGHCYSQAFWKALHLEVQRLNPEWPHLLQNTAEALQNLQIPYHEILEYH